MTLPQLYRNLTLTSYDKIRYRGDQPEGMGSASPFSMGLNAVITRPYASLVRSLTLRGHWREHELEEHARIGRVPDSSMMLNMAVRAAVDRMPELESFTWDLNTKMLETVYVGLAQLPKLMSLTVRFPSSRHPRPTVVIPPMPRLRCLKITDIDPLCYPDDISTLLLKGKKLRELKMHWSPRMRNQQEPSVMLHDYFRKCAAAKQPLAIKKLSLQNLYALHSEDFNVAFDPHTVEDVTILNGTGAEAPNFMNTFVDNTWPNTLPDRALKIRSMRQDGLSKRHSDFLGNFSGLQRLYFVNKRGDSSDALNTPQSAGPTSTDATSPTAPNGSGNSPSASPASGAQTSLRDSYLNNIMSNHGATLRHLLLPSRWPLPASTIARLVHTCPNLEQLALATEFSSMDTLGLLVPFLRRLVALRLLVPTGCSAAKSTGEVRRPGQTMASASASASASPTNEEKILTNVRSLADVLDLDDSFLVEKLSTGMADKQVFGNLKMVGMGWKAWELQDYYTVPTPAPVPAETSTIATPADTETNANANGTTDEQAPKDQNPPSNPKPNPDSTKPSASSGPYSSLGKRRRDDTDTDTAANPDAVADTNANSTTITTDSPTTRGLQDPCTTTPPWAAPGLVWRRRVRRVGWEVLRHWEIWALDTQEL